MMTLTGVKR